LGSRTNNGGTGFGTIFLRIVFAAVLCLGVWYGFAIQREKSPATPQLASLEGLFGTNITAQTSEPEQLPPSESVAPLPSVPTNSVAAPTNKVAETESVIRQVRSVQNTLDAQIALARKGISVGTIDGVPGENMKRALLAFQIHNNLQVSGELDAETKNALTIEEPLFIQYMVSDDDLKRLMPIPSTWLGKSEADRLDFETLLELVAEKGRSSQSFIRKINPQVNWTNVVAGTLIKIPRIDPPRPARAAFARVHLYSKTINVFGKSTNLIAHFPCSIAANKEKRPVGQLFVEKAALNPTYLFSPEVFSESAEAKKIARKLNIPAGPNNPVGTAWIGLSRPGYGIHGTPKPEQIGRTESHGCFRLANWNAEHLLQMSWAGMPVYIEP